MYNHALLKVYNTTPKLGEDCRYHYLYKIVNTANNKFYYGIHSTRNLDDGYSGSGTILQKAYDKWGYDNFKMYVLEQFATREQLINKERDIVNAELLADPNCYNLILGGSAHLYSKFSVRGADGKKYFVSREEFLSHPELYKMKTTQGKVRLNNGTQNILVDPEDVDEYISRGWSRGQTIKSHEGKIAINNGSREKWIIESQLEYYLANGWLRGGVSRNRGQKSFAKNLVWVNDGIKCKRVPYEKSLELIANGWVNGPIQSTNKGKIAVTNGTINKLIRVGDSIPVGFYPGMTSKRVPRCWVNNILENKMIPKTELTTYINKGWRVGRK